MTIAIAVSANQTSSLRFKAALITPTRAVSTLATGIARLAILTQVPVIPCAQFGAEKLLPRYGKLPRFWRRTPVSVWAGPALDFSRWKGRSEDGAALKEATEYVMSAVTRLLEEIRGESAPAEIFDPHNSQLPRTGNFRRERN